MRTRVACALAIALFAPPADARSTPQDFGPFIDPSAPVIRSGAPETDPSDGAADLSRSRRDAQESKPLGPSLAKREGAQPARGAGGGAPSSGGNDWLLRTGGALALVLVLIFALRAGVRRVASRTGLAGQIGAAGRAPSGVLEALGRYPVARGQTLVLLRLDRRVLLVSQSSGGFATLAEITDPDEVASLLVQARDDEGETMARRFSGLLRDMERDPSIAGDIDTGAEPDDAPRATPRGTLAPEPLPDVSAPDPASSLRRRLRALRAAAGGRAA